MSRADNHKLFLLNIEQQHKWEISTLFDKEPLVGGIQMNISNLIQEI